MAQEDEIPFEVKKAPLVGRYLVSKKDFPAGQLIFQEPPLIMYSKCDTEDTLWDERMTICIRCFRTVTKIKSICCLDCQWPFCSWKCSKDPVHQKLECQILELNRIYPSPEALRHLYLLRFEMMKEKEKSKWDTIMSLASTFGSVTAECSGNLARESSDACQFLKTYCDITVDLDYIKKVINIFKINSYCFKEKGEKEDTFSRKFCALYGMCCLMPHSCAPSVEWYLPTSNQPGTIGIYTRTPIAVGQKVTLSYWRDGLAQGTRQRKETIFNRFGFLCVCDRCVDGSELGTFYSAVKCRTCPSGYLLPPTCFSPDPHYQCNSCNSTLPTENVDTLETYFRNKVIAENEKSGAARLKGLDLLILNATAHYRLHHNHNLVIAIINSWIFRQDLNILFDSNAPSYLLYHKMLDRSQQALQIAVAFGTVIQRVNLEALIAKVLIRFNFKSGDYLTIEQDISDLDEKIAIVQRIVKHLRNGVEIADSDILDHRTNEIAEEMIERLDVWNRRLLEIEAPSQQKNDDHPGPSNCQPSPLTNTKV